jgi:hypothetical protein
MNPFSPWLGKAMVWGAGWLWLSGLLAAGPSPAQMALREYDVKAAFLRNFATFAEWPATAFPQPDSPFVIGVLGEDPFGPILDQIMNGEHIGKRPVLVRRCKRLDDARSCQLLFISASEAARLDEILRRLDGLPVLTVGDTPDFAEKGGQIGFVTTTSVRFNINQQAVRNAGLAISSKILHLAQLVQSPPRATP